MKLRPLNDRILVKRVEEEEKTKGGIIIPDTAKEKSAEGKVVAVGVGAGRSPVNPIRWSGAVAGGQAPRAHRVGDRRLLFDGV